MDIDYELRQLFPANPVTAPTSKLVVLATIEVVGGFEAFNTRPYHNYETWGQGYRITSQGVSVIDEKLEAAIMKWEKKKGEGC